MRVFDFNSAIVRAPGRSVVDGLRSNTGPPPVYEAVLAEHYAYVAALRAAGLEVTILPALEPFPDSVFIEDPALVFTQAALMLRPGAATRRAEARELADTFAARFPQTLRLDDGFADGGDILVTPGRVYIGLSARTDRVGAAALQKLLGTIGLESEVVQVPQGTLHLKSDCSLVDEETVMATETLANSGLLRDLRVLPVPDRERAAANAVRVNDVLLVSAGHPRTTEMLQRHGVHVRPLAASEVGKIDAGLSCMSLRWFDPALLSSPEARP